MRTLPIRIDVQREHILTATYWPRESPICRAIVAALGCETVACGMDGVEIDGLPVGLPLVASEWHRSYTAGDAVRPFQFTLHVPRSWML